MECSSILTTAISGLPYRIRNSHSVVETGRIKRALRSRNRDRVRSANDTVARVGLYNVACRS